MSTKATAADIRRGLQGLLSHERDLVYKVENAIAGGQYRRLRDLADALVEIEERRAQLRSDLADARGRDDAERARDAARHNASDDAVETWRLLH